MKATFKAIFGMTLSLASALAATESIAEQGIVTGNFKTYKRAEYTAYAGMWSLYVDPTMGLGRTAVENVDYVSNMTTYLSKFPNNTRATFRVPAKPSASGVYGYMYVAYGNHENTGPQKQIVPRRVYELTKLTTKLGFTVQGEQSSGLLHEFWLTSAPHASGKFTSKLFEVGLFARTPSHVANYMNSVTQIGTYNDGKRGWKVAVNYKANGGKTPFIMLAPADRSDFQGSFEWAPVLRWLAAQGIISGTEWFNGMAFGVEPYSGSAVVNLDFEVVAYAGAAQVPWTITDLVAVADSDDEIVLNFTPASGATSHQFRRNGGAWAAVPADKVIRGLTPLTEYYFEVRGVNSTGFGLPSGKSVVTTKAPRASDIIKNGSFDTDAYWQGFGRTGKRIANAAAEFASTIAWNGIMQPNLPFIPGKYYDVTFDAVVYSGGIRADFLGGVQRSSAPITATGSYTLRLLANTGNSQLMLFATGKGFSGNLDNVKVIGPYETPRINGV